MNDEVRKLLYQQVRTAQEVAKAKLLVMSDIVAPVPLALEPDDQISPMKFSARMLGLNERSPFVWLSWSGEHAEHVEDGTVRKVLIDHVRRTRLLSSKLDPQSTYKVWVREALEFAHQQGWSAVRHASPAEAPTGLVAPAPLSTSEMAFCFADLYGRSEQQWTKELGKSKSIKWLSACVHTPGRQGRGQPGTLWNPVQLGAALVGNEHASQNSVRARFQTKPSLTPWLALWNEYEAEFLSTL